jgi:hypothetical protein
LIYCSSYSWYNKSSTRALILFILFPTTSSENSTSFITDDLWIFTEYMNHHSRFVLSNIIATSHIRLLGTWNMAGVTEEVNAFTFYWNWNLKTGSSLRYFSTMLTLLFLMGLHFTLTTELCKTLFKLNAF